MPKRGRRDLTRLTSGRTEENTGIVEARLEKCSSGLDKSHAQQREQLRVLVVEDEAVIALHVQELLSSAGHIVIGPFSDPRNFNRSRYSRCGGSRNSGALWTRGAGQAGYPFPLYYGCLTTLYSGGISGGVALVRGGRIGVHPW